MESGEPVVHEFRLRCADGSAQMVREVLRRVVAGDGPVLRGVILDIADEIAAREAVDRLAAVIEHQTEPLLVVAPRERATDEPTVLQVNPAFARLASATSDQMIGRLLSEAVPWLPKIVRLDLDEHLAFHPMKSQGRHPMPAAATFAARRR